MEEIDPVIVMGVSGQAVELPVADGPATGYSWMLDLPPGVVRIDDASAQPTNLARSLGASASGALRVLAPKGTYRITARLVRPWEQDKPVQTMRIDLVIEGQKDGEPSRENRI